MTEADTKTLMVERYPDPSVEDPQLYDQLLALPGDQVSWKVEHMKLAMTTTMPSIVMDRAMAPTVVLS